MKKLCASSFKFFNLAQGHCRVKIRKIRLGGARWLQEARYFRSFYVQNSLFRCLGSQQRGLCMSQRKFGIRLCIFREKASLQCVFDKSLNCRVTNAVISADIWRRTVQIQPTMVKGWYSFLLALCFVPNYYFTVSLCSLIYLYNTFFAYDLWENTSIGCHLIHRLEPLPWNYLWVLIVQPDHVHLLSLFCSMW
jgi:hypothetical protein